MTFTAERDEHSEAQRIDESGQDASALHGVANIAGMPRLPVLSVGEPAPEHRAPQDMARVRDSYDAVADAYTLRVHDELRGKPLDRGLLNAFADQVDFDHGPGARVCDVGCGPGHVGAFLVARGLEVTGIDLSPAMVERARSLHPEMTFEVGDMTALHLPDGGFEGIVAFYSIIHLRSDGEVRTALQEFRRVLAANGLLLVAVHLGEHGDATVHADDMLGVSDDMDFRYFDADRLAAAMTDAGFHIEARLIRGPYEGVEVQTTRAYLLGRRTGQLLAE